MTWIKSDTILKGKLVDLVPMTEAHFEELDQLAQNESIWEFLSPDMSTPEKRLFYFNEALKERDKATQFPFVIFHKETQKLIGSTRLMEIVFAHKKLEIGWTWLHPDFWATAINPECKLLLLTFCFEQLQAIRVQFKANEKNVRSCKAIVKIGAKPEGVLRNDVIRDNGIIRNTAYFSIIDSEWTEVKSKLEALFLKKLFPS